MRVTILERRPLRFDRPFGVGEDRHVHVRAASSIVPFAGGHLIAQDDSTFAACWTEGGIAPIRLFPGEFGDTFSAARGNKQHKPDLECGFEAVVEGRRAAVFFGSGSTPRRHRAAIVFEDSGEVRVADVAPLHRRIIGALGIAPASLNLEGATRVDDRLWLAQRGNDGENGVNALVSASWTAVEALLAGRLAAFDLQAFPIELGRLEGARLGFTSLDARADGTLLYAAAAEASENTYDDGACTGSELGIVTQDGRIMMRAQVGSGTDKVEGVTVTSDSGGVVEAWAVVDADDPERPAEALRLRAEGL